MTTYVDVQLHLKIDEEQLHILASMLGIGQARDSASTAMVIRRAVSDLSCVESVERIVTNPLRGVPRELCACPHCPRPEHANEPHR